MAKLSSSRSFAIIGAGSVVIERHLPALQAAGSRAASVFDPLHDAAQLAARRFGIQHIASTAEEAIADDTVHAVLVASPNAFHREHVECAIRYSRHVLCEKPIALSLADARAMAEAARRAGVVLQLGFHHRFSAEHLCVKRLIQAGLLGEVRAFSGTISEPFAVIPGGLGNYRLDPAVGGGLTLVDVGQHRIDQILDLLGDIASVSCEMASVMESHGLDDSVVLSLVMGSGALGSLGWHRFSRAFTSPLMLYGTRATVGCGAFIAAPFQSAPVSVFLESDPAEILPREVISWTRPSRWWGDLEPGWVDIWPPRRDTFRDQLVAFQEAIEDGSKPPADAVDGYRALEVVQAAYQSFAERRSVSLPVATERHWEPPAW